MFSDDIIFYVENSKELKKNPLKINKLLEQVAGYKIDIEKSTAFQYINNEPVEFETKNAMPFILAHPPNEILI